MSAAMASLQIAGEKIEMTTLRPLQDNPIVEDSITAIGQSAPPAPTDHSSARKAWFEIPFIPIVENQLIISVRLNRRLSGLFLLDTGATHTIITPHMAERLQLGFQQGSPAYQIATANGIVAVPVVTLAHISAGQFETSNIEAVVQDLGNQPLLTGILGMNFFEDLDFIICREGLLLGTLNASLVKLSSEEVLPLVLGRD